MFKELNAATAKPTIWSEYTADVLWTDRHIAEQMLAYHLNPEIDAASRSTGFISDSVSWLVSEFDLDEGSKTIDFGCGPGLYTQRFKDAGIGTVVGLDFSENSISYAQQKAKASNLAIEYHLGNYLEYSDPRTFDLITLVMCDLCALSPSQRFTLFAKFKSILKPEGVIALDVYTESRFTDLTEDLNVEKNAMNGFWSQEEYWCIKSSFTYDSDLVALDKYVIYEEQREWEIYNWLQHFTVEMLDTELDPHGLEVQTSYNDLRGTPLADGSEMAVIISHA
ncbi:class I SAM-dependent methyltransferase [Parasphingopyxis sp.]|uniref:class I SAM-dependent methyltransferase n=1 Tax=Parasphingopyxis sp. TaxID=1920299 RepID=UPI0026373ED2|nr:class I SAM-dependent methyltransferase [Parasphingopyxis sp.]